MVKIGTLGMFKTAQNNPIVIADGETANGYIFTVGSDGKADAPVAGTSSANQTKELLIALNDISGDDAYNGNATIASGALLNGYFLKAWNGKTLIFNEDNISYATGEDFSDIVAGTTVMVANTDGNLIAADETVLKAAEHDITFTVKKKLQFAGNAIEVEINVG